MTNPVDQADRGGDQPPGESPQDADVIPPAVIESRPVSVDVRRSRAQEVRVRDEAFARLPGIHLGWRRVARGHFQLVDNDGVDARAEIDKPWARVRRVRIGAKTYRLRRGLYDESTRTQVFRVDGHNFNSHSGAAIRFDDGRVFLFPVAGETARTAVMTAVDDSGNGVIKFRKVPQNPDSWLMKTLNPMPVTEVAVHPDWPLTEELLLIIVTAGPFLESYFQKLSQSVEPAANDRGDGPMSTGPEQGSGRLRNKHFDQLEQL